MRCIGRLRSEASPSKVAVIGQPATAPMTSRQPVPELPKSSTPAVRESRRRRRPAPAMRPRRCARRVAPSARMALPVLSTSSPSSRPEMRVSPTVKRAEDQGAVRDRLVARDAHAARKRAAAAGGRAEIDGGVVHRRPPACEMRPPSMRPRGRHPRRQRGRPVLPKADRRY